MTDRLACSVSSAGTTFLQHGIPLELHEIREKLNSLNLPILKIQPEKLDRQLFPAGCTVHARHHINIKKKGKMV